MPILKREPDASPEGLFDLPLDRFPWWVAHVRSRQEKALARWVSPHGIPYFLPMQEKRVKRAGRLFVSHLPLFPGYLFFRGRRDDRRVVLESNLLTRAIEVLDQHRLGEELSQIHRLQELGATLVPRPFFSKGDEVRVTEGPFQGYKGVVVQEKGATRLIVSVSLLRKAVAVEFDRAILAPAGPRRLSNSAERAIA